GSTARNGLALARSLVAPGAQGHLGDPRLLSQLFDCLIHRNLHLLKCPALLLFAVSHLLHLSSFLPPYFGSLESGDRYADTEGVQGKESRSRPDWAHRYST